MGREALKGMSLLYTSFKSHVIVVPEVPAHAASSRPYWQRGWCFFELSIAFDHGCIANDDLCEPSLYQMIDDMCYSLDPCVLEESFQTKSFTDAGDKDVVVTMYKDLYRNQ